MSDKKPIAFQQEREITKTKGLKLSNKSSQFKTDEVKAKASETFDQKAEQFMSDRQEQQAKGVDIAKNFLSAIRDKTLLNNKGVLNKENEKEIREDFQHLILDLNNDPSQKYDGMGSLSGIALLVKVIFEMRDRMNAMEYELTKIKKELSSQKKNENA